MILVKPVNKTSLQKCKHTFSGLMVKAVADIKKEIIAIDAEYHADLQAELLMEGFEDSDEYENRSNQENLWGFNILLDDLSLEYDSLINIRPRQNNRSREIQDSNVRNEVQRIASLWVKQNDQ